MKVKLELIYLVPLMVSAITLVSGSEGSSDSVLPFGTGGSRVIAGHKPGFGAAPAHRPHHGHHSRKPQRPSECRNKGNGPSSSGVHGFGNVPPTYDKDNQSSQGGDGSINSETSHESHSSQTSQYSYGGSQGSGQSTKSGHNGDSTHSTPFTGNNYAGPINGTSPSHGQPATGKVYGAPVEEGGYGGKVTPDANTVVVRGRKFKGSLPKGKDFSLLSLDMLWDGKGTQFGSKTDFWQGGACMYDDLPHANLPSVAMTDAHYLEGLACGACVEIPNLPPNSFKPGQQFGKEPPQHWPADKPLEGETTLAFVSDECPGGQCMGGIDSHYDTWKSYTGLEDGTELKIKWRFVSCEKLFRRSGSGGDALEVHWRQGASQGFCDVQIRGAYRPVVQVEFSIKGSDTWNVAVHRDNSFWQADKCGPNDQFAFRLTSADGEVIESEGAYVPIGKHMKFDGGLNF